MQTDVANLPTQAEIDRDSACAGDKSTKPSLVRLLLVLLFALYPFVVWAGMRMFGPAITAAGMAIALFLRALFEQSQRRSEGALLFTAAALFVGIGATLQRAHLVLFTPVLISLGLLAIFASTLIRPPSMIERFARRMKPEFPAAAADYCRSVTVIWCVFFGLNALVASATVLSGSLPLWTWYNGCISYMLIALLFAGEFFYRARWKRRHELS